MIKRDTTLKIILQLAKESPRIKRLLKKPRKFDQTLIKQQKP